MFPPPVSQSSDFGFLLLDDPVESVDADAGFLKVLVGKVCPLMYGGDEAVGHGMCGSVKVHSFLHAEYGFGCAR